MEDEALMGVAKDFRVEILSNGARRVRDVVTGKFVRDNGQYLIGQSMAAGKNAKSVIDAVADVAQVAETSGVAEEVVKTMPKSNWKIYAAVTAGVALVTGTTYLVMKRKRKARELELADLGMEFDDRTNEEFIADMNKENQHDTKPQVAETNVVQTWDADDTK